MTEMIFQQGYQTEVRHCKFVLSHGLRTPSNCTLSSNFYPKLFISIYTETTHACEDLHHQHATN